MSIWAIGGLILLSLGVLGEYIGRIYLESKGRPRFLIDEYLADGEGEYPLPKKEYNDRILYHSCEESTDK